MASMAKPEAPRSSPSNGLADSYIGSLISLTSKSDIRYEGLFYNISTEESTIGLTNVRSFGTEGRKQDGPQVVPSDKVYEYILFRASDIKDLKVISSPQAQPATTPPVFNDPAIVQTHYPQAANPSANVQPPTFQSNLPSYQPDPNLAPPPSLPNPNTNTVTHMYYPGYYGSSNGFQQQQSLLTPPPLGLSVPPSPIQQTQHLQQPQSLIAPPPGLLIPSYYGSGPSGISALDSSQSPSALLPVPNFQLSLPQSSSLASNSLNMSPSAFVPIPSFQSSVIPAQPSLLNPAIVPTQAPPQPLNKPAIQSQVSDKPTQVPEPSTAPIVGSSSSVLNEGAMPSLITPGQFLQLGPSSASLAQPPQSVSQTDSEATRASLLPPPQTSQTSSESQGLLSSNVAPESQGPLLPLPTPAEYKSHTTHRHHQPRNNYRGGSHRGRGNMMSRPVNRFTEEFDFIAMNEKFNKDEVWGDIGKNMKAQEDGTESQDDDDGLPKPESNPVYVKDDFFDSLSCNSLDRGAQNGRHNFSQQRRRDTETFGFVPRQNRGGGQGRGGYGQGRGGGYGQGGGYYGRGGNGYVGRGRGGHNFPGRGS